MPYWGFSNGLCCWQVGYSKAAVARLVSVSGVHALGLAHNFCFYHHVCSVCVSLLLALGDRWQRLANVKWLFILSPWLFRAFSVVDAFWSVFTYNAWVFTLHAVTHMSIHKTPCFSSSSSLASQAIGCCPGIYIYPHLGSLLLSPKANEQLHCSQVYHWEEFPLCCLSRSSTEVLKF